MYIICTWAGLEAPLNFLLLQISWFLFFFNFRPFIFLDFSTQSNFNPSFFCKCAPRRGRKHNSRHRHKAFCIKKSLFRPRNAPPTPGFRILFCRRPLKNPSKKLWKPILFQHFRFSAPLSPHKYPSHLPSKVFRLHSPSSDPFFHDFSENVLPA